MWDSVISLLLKSDWGLLEALPTKSALENIETCSYIVNNNYL